MGLWNVWSALATGLLIGGSIGTLLAALLTVSKKVTPRQPEVRKMRAERFHVGVGQSDEVSMPQESIDSLADARVPLHFH